MPQRSFDASALILHRTDNVAVLKRPVKPGEELIEGSRLLQVTQLIGAGHKIALEEIPKGSLVRKYGQIIGRASDHIGPGEHVHSHNLELQDFERDMAFCDDTRPTEPYPAEQMQYFSGY